MRRLPCVVTARPGATLHHCHGGSVGVRLAEMGLDPMRGMAARGFSEALVIPLCAELHCFDGEGIDANVGRAEWERRWRTQADYLDEVGRMVGYSLWELHRSWLGPKAVQNAELKSRWMRSRLWRPLVLDDIQPASNAPAPIIETIGGETLKK